MSDRKFVSVRLPFELVEKIDELAKREHNPRSTIIRRILSEYFSKK